MEEGEMRHKLEIRLHHEGIKRSTALEKKTNFMVKDKLHGRNLLGNDLLVHLAHPNTSCHQSRFFL